MRSPESRWLRSVAPSWLWKLISECRVERKIPDRDKLEDILKSISIDHKVMVGAYKFCFVFPNEKFVIKVPILLSDPAAKAFWEEYKVYRRLSSVAYKYLAVHYWIRPGLLLCERLSPLATSGVYSDRRYMPVADKFFRAGVFDVHEGNFGVDNTGTPKLLDLSGHSHNVYPSLPGAEPWDLQLHH